MPQRFLLLPLIAMLVACALGAGAASPDDARVARLERALPGFATDRSPRFVLIADAGEAERAAMLEVMEATAESVERFADRFGLSRRLPGAPMVAVAFRDRSAFERFAATEDRVDARALGGYWLPGAERTVFRAGPPAHAEPGRGGAGGGALASIATADLATVAHETAHQVLHRLGIQRRSPGQPLWIREGLAIAFESVASDGPDADPFARRAARERRLRDARTLPLQRLVTATALPQPGRGDARRFYEQSASLTAYLARERPSEFAAYLIALRDGAGRLRARDALATFERIFGPIESVESGWHASLRTP